MSAFRRSSTGFSSLSSQKPIEIDIVLDGAGPGSFVHSYATLDRISGHVTIVCAKDCPFQELQISFDGITETYIDKVATTSAIAGRAVGSHRFLKLLQPVDPALLPQNNLAVAGASYQIPFEFVVPDQLLEQQCTHPVNSPQVRQAHLQIPPSFGDPMLAGDGHTLQDDLAPEMTKISYLVKATFIKSYPTATKPSERIQKGVKVRIVPTREEDPPLDIGQECKDYGLRKAKDVRKGWFKGKLGRLTAEAHQPASFRLPALKDPSPSTISTVTTVDLRFDPIDGKVQPPTLSTLSSTLKVKTFFSSDPFTCFPIKSTLNAWCLDRGMFVRTVDLSHRCVSSVEWQKHASTHVSATSSPRHRSTCSDQSFSDAANEPAPPSDSPVALPFYTAKVLVPSALPPGKSFPPTFFSCLVGRSYSLDLSLSYHAPSTTVSTPSIQLKLPVQISTQPSRDAVVTPSAEEAEAIATQEVDAEMAQGRFMSRDMAPPTPSPEYREQAPAVALPILPYRGRNPSAYSDEGPPPYSLGNSAPPHLRGGSGAPGTLAALDTITTARPHRVSVN